MQCVAKCRRPFGLGVASEVPRLRRALLGCVLLSLFTRSGAQEAPGARRQRNEVDLGIVVNQTVTAAGQEFYRRFTDFWREKPDFESFTLVILERPSSRFGSRVVVSYGQTVVFTGNLPVKTDAIRALGAEAVERAHASVIAANLRMDGASDPDMGSNEI